MPYVDPRRRLISRWPIFDSGRCERSVQGASPYSTTSLDPDALHAWVMVRPGKVVAAANVHLSSGSGEDALRLEEARPLAALGRLGGPGTPVFLTGDFNTSSHLDGSGGDVTRLLSDAGLRDSYREAHPDAALRPGHTFTPGAPHGAAPGRARIRIDYIFTAGRSETLSSQVVGESGGAVTDIPVFPWPSDHRAVVSTFRVVPDDAPALLAATPRRVPPGDPVLLRTWDPSGPGWTALVAPRGGAPADAITGVRDMPHDWQRMVPVSTVGLAPGGYDALLVGEGGEVLRRCAFAVAEPGARPEVAAVSSAVPRGNPIRVRWRGAPGDLRDWIGLYRAGETDVSRYLGFVYTEAGFDGEADLPVDPRDPWPAGDYELRLMHDESYVVLATAAVAVTR
jgi:endonuclease/exonuclease/phosphatase family metal-dependent hydrolase